MPQPVLLITGTSSGIGLAAAVEAARSGWQVVATLRDLERADALRAAATQARVDVDIRRLDVTEPESIASCLAGVASDYGRLDALLNNAGAGHLGTIELESVDAVRGVMEVNFFGVVAVTKAAMPLLRESRGRVVTVSSVGGVIGQPFNEAYCAAKFAVEGFTESFASVAATVGVRVSVVEPGAVRSDFVANVDVDRNTLLAEAGPYAPALGAYLDRTGAAFASPNAQTPEEAAAVVLAVLAAPEPPARVQTSDWARAFVGLKYVDTDGSTVQSAMADWLAD
ncbi:SDR family NAD(P)-dependent oxidoreductase [Microbacteriaceae bacterium VKM Ac-2854]|nr:SDR family NAD(P)-dependent oxidoreductase [Microbacteriaceae bacterium VKM Ac-2854]